MNKILCLVLGMCMLLCLAACQPTPDTAVVAGKNGELEKLIMQPAVSGNPMLDTLPERWKEETEFKSGVTLVIDAAIEIPGAKDYPVIEAAPHAFMLEEAQSYVGILMRGQPVYEIRPSRIKSDWDKEILQLKADIESTKNDDSLTEDMRKQILDGLNGELAYLIEQYNNAPEKKPDPVPASMTFIRQSDTLQVLGVEADLGQASSALLDIHISDDNLDNGVMFFDGSSDVYTVGLQTDTAAGMMPKEEAQQKAEELIKGLGIEDMQLAYTEVYADPGGITDSDLSVLASDPKIKKCYVFNYCPFVSGIPATVNRYYYGNSEEPQEYDKVWHDETIIVYVNDSGVYRMDWYSPDDLGEVLNENAALLDFEKIKGTLENQMFYQKTWISPGIEDATISIQKVKLGMMRVRLREDRYVYLPVWDFIGDWTYVDTNIDDTAGGVYDVSFLTINAIDGSVINREYGY